MNVDPTFFNSKKAQKSPIKNIKQPKPRTYTRKPHNRYSTGPCDAKDATEAREGLKVDPQIGHAQKLIFMVAPLTPPIGHTSSPYHGGVRSGANADPRDLYDIHLTLHLDNMSKQRNNRSGISGQHITTLFAGVALLKLGGRLS